MIFSYIMLGILADSLIKNRATQSGYDNNYIMEVTLERLQRLLIKKKKMKIYNQYYAYHAAKFGIEFGRVVNDVKVRMTDPGFSSSVIQCLRQLQILTPAVMILNPDTIAIRIRLDGFRKDWLYLQRVEIFSAFRR